MGWALPPFAWRAAHAALEDPGPNLGTSRTPRLAAVPEGEYQLVRLAGFEAQLADTDGKVVGQDERAAKRLLQFFAEGLVPLPFYEDGPTSLVWLFYHGE